MEKIVSIDAGSPASRSLLKPGDLILSINGHPVEDVLDYKFYTYEPRLTVAAKAENGKFRCTVINKQEGEDPGIQFETYLMDKPRACRNRCVFCFVDQLPKGMRRTLYFKDDDARLSFLQGNYITLTNLSERELERIAALHISPINVSVHATEPELRCRLLGNDTAGDVLEKMKKLAAAGVEMNCQIVSCPGWNDGAALSRTMSDLAELYPQVNSVSIVPVGLTKHRQGLAQLTPYTKETACATIRQVEEFAARCMEKHGSSIFFCSDELYLRAELPLPEEEYYEGYPQLENGVGLLRLQETEFMLALEEAEECVGTPFAIATGVSAAPHLEKLISAAKEKFPQLSGRVYPIVNDFFGHTIDVAGLITGVDLTSQLAGRDLGSRLLIPECMLRQDEAVFLDDVTVEEASNRLGVPVLPVISGGIPLLQAMLA